MTDTDWDTFIQPLIQRAEAAEQRREPVKLTRAEVDEFYRRVGKPDEGDEDVDDMDLLHGFPLTLLGVPVVIVDPASTTDKSELFTLGLVLAVAKVINDHGYGPLGGHGFTELGQHLFHFLHGRARGDTHCTGGTR